MVDGKIARILRQVIEIQLEQSDLLQQLTHAVATSEMDTHIYIVHDGNNLRCEYEETRRCIAAKLKQNQEKLRELIVELYQVQASVMF